MEGVKGVNGKITSFLSNIRPIPAPQSVQVPENNDVNQTQVEQGDDEISESEEESSE